MRRISVFNAYKFYELEPERHVQSWFFVLFLAYSALMMGLSGKDLQTRILLQITEWLINPSLALPEIDPIFYVYMSLYPLVLLMGFILAVSYAATMVGNVIRKEQKSALPQVLRKIFPLIIFSCICGGIHLLSILLLEIPYYFFMSAFYFVPLKLVLERQSLSKAMEQSWRLTKGYKLQIFTSVIAVTFLLRFLAQFLVGILASSAWAGSLLMGFFFAFRTLASGRLNGIIYLSQLSIRSTDDKWDDL
ncbi:MAG: hypothetical protein ACOYEL_03070 [Saccharofermentanales bacterium]|jgi:hypothetical protein